MNGLLRHFRLLFQRRLLLLALRVPGGGLAALRLVPDGIDGPLRRALAAIPVIQALVELVPGQVHFQHPPVQVVILRVLLQQFSAALHRHGPFLGGVHKSKPLDVAVVIQCFQDPRLVQSFDVYHFLFLAFHLFGPVYRVSIVFPALAVQPFQVFAPPHHAPPPPYVNVVHQPFMQGAPGRGIGGRLSRWPLLPLAAHFPRSFTSRTMSRMVAAAQ